MSEYDAEDERLQRFYDERDDRKAKAANELYEEQRHRAVIASYTTPELLTMLNKPQWFGDWPKWIKQELIRRQK